MNLLLRGSVYYMFSALLKVKSNKSTRPDNIHEWVFKGAC